ncbi:hypothetical protein Tco_0072238 [Tanacetum coccineum]
MASSSSSFTLEPAKNVAFQPVDCEMKLNNSVALLESIHKPLQDLFYYLMKSPVAVALTKEPSNYYPQYLREFWYTAEADSSTKSITFSLSTVKEKLTIDIPLFADLLGLPKGDTFVNPPSKDVLKKSFASLGLHDPKHPELTSCAQKSVANTSPLKVMYFSPVWKTMMTYMVKVAIKEL